MIYKIDGQRKTVINRRLLVDGVKICNTCKVAKPLTDYHKHKDRIGGVCDECKKCVQSRNKKRYSVNGWKGPEKLKRLKETAQKNNVPFNLTSEDIEEVYQKQKGLCYYSGIPLSHIVNSIYGISVDRIIPSNGYVKENIALCCYVVNIMKHNLSYEVFLDICKHIVKNQRPITKGLGKRLDEFNKRDIRREKT